MQLRPESRPIGRASLVRRRDAGLQVGVGAGRGAVRGARPGRIERWRGLGATRGDETSTSTASADTAREWGRTAQAYGRWARPPPMRRRRPFEHARIGPTSPGGAWMHLVRASRCGARMRPTIEPACRGQGCHCPCSWGGRNVLHTPTRDRTGNKHLGRRSRIRKRTLSRGGSREGSRFPITSRVTGSFGHQARKSVGTAALIARSRIICHRSPSGIGGRSRISGRSAGSEPPIRSSRPRRLARTRASALRVRERAPGAWQRRHGRSGGGDLQAVRPGRTGIGCDRRPTPRASRSAWMTRAAATSSGSRVTVPATQSM